MSKKISFIVPCYNIEEYIIRCLTSLVNQNIPTSDYDIIVINDGSPDNGLELISEFAKSHENIRIYSQKNQGLSTTRNNGLQYVDSQYVWFIDGDDWIAENCLKELLEIAVSLDLDMFEVAPSIPFQSDFQSVFDKTKSVSPVLSGQDRILRKGSFTVGAWAYIFNTNFLNKNGLRFMEGVVFEDSEFTPRALFLAEKIACLESFSVYSYFIRSGSICNSFSQKYIDDNMATAKSLFEFTNRHTMKKEVRNILLNKVTNMIISLFRILGENNIEHDVFANYLNQSKQNKLYPFPLSGSNLKRKVFLFMWNHFPNTVYKIRKKQLAK